MRSSAPKRQRSAKLALCLLAGLSLALALTGTAAASETTGFVAESYPASVTGTQSSTLNISTSYGNFTCKNTKLEGTAWGPSKSLETEHVVSSEYCTGPFYSVYQLQASGCQFKYTSTASGSGQMSVVPEGCGPVRLKAPGGGFCDIEIPSQTALNASLTNTGSGSGAGVRAETRATNLVWVQGCTGTKHTNGAIEATWNLTAKNGSGGADGLSIDEEFQIAPGASTGLASGVGSGAATLAGSVNAHDLDTSYWFEYGTTASYGSKSSEGEVGHGSTAVSVTKGLEGLSSGTVYHYRLVAKNESGTSYGRDETLQTVNSGATPAAFSWPSGTTVQVATALSGEQVFKTAKGNVSCQQVGGSSGALSGTGASSLPVGELSYHDSEKTKCRGPFGTSPTVETNGCELQFHAGEHGGTNEADGSVTLGGCTGGQNAIVMNAAGCVIKLPAQSLGAVTLVTIGGGLIEAQVNATGLTDEISGYLCGTGTYTNGSYTGTIVLNGSKGNLTVE